MAFKFEEQMFAKRRLYNPSALKGSVTSEIISLRHRILNLPFATVPPLNQTPGITVKCRHKLEGGVKAVVIKVLEGRHSRDREVEDDV